MKHSLTLARFHFTIKFTEEMLKWLKENFPEDWFVMEDGRYWFENFWEGW